MADYSDLVGIPFGFGGRDRLGIDCLGLVIEVYRRLGLAVPDVEDYSAESRDVTGGIYHALQKTWHPVCGPWEPYDVLVFAGRCCGNAATHCAVYLGHDRMLHALERCGVVISRISLFRWPLIGAWRHEAMACRA